LRIQLDYGTTPGNRVRWWIDLVYLLLVAGCVAGAITAEILMPGSPHRLDRTVEWVMFLAHAAAAASSVLFCAGWVELIRNGRRALSRPIGIAWIISGIVPPAIFLFTRSGGSFLYR
jgi:hypothetical protein